MLVLKKKGAGLGSDKVKLIQRSEYLTQVNIVFLKIVQDRSNDIKDRSNDNIVMYSVQISDMAIVNSFLLHATNRKGKKNLINGFAVRKIMFEQVDAGNTRLTPFVIAVTYYILALIIFDTLLL